MEIKKQTYFFYVHEVKNECWTIFLKPNSFRDMNFQKCSITDESFINVYETDNLHDSSVIDHFWKFISRKLLSFEKWFTTHFLPHGHRKKMSAFLFPFSTLLVKNFHAEHLGRFFNDHPLFPFISSNYKDRDLYQVN